MAMSDDDLADAETSTRDTAPLGTPRPTTDHGQFQPGTVLRQRSRIASLLGRGGMGEVYRTDDLRLGQPVALKLIRAPLANDPGRLARLHEEMRIARQVSHPNVCRVYDIGAWRRRLSLSMEYVAGAPSSELIGNAIFTFDPGRAYLAGSLVEAAVIGGVGLAGWRLSRGRSG
jgi:Protein kinase domain